MSDELLPSTIKEIAELGEKTVVIPPADVKNLAAALGKLFRCENCGKCCAGDSGIGLTRLLLTPHDIRAIATGLRCSRKVVKRLTVTENGKRWAPLPCAFLKDNECSIHAFRPSSCRSFPILDGPVIDGQKSARLSIMCSRIKKLWDL